MWHAFLKQQLLGNSHHLSNKGDDDMDIDTMFITCNRAMIDAASKILGERNIEGKRQRSPKIFSTTVMIGQI